MLCNFETGHLIKIKIGIFDNHLINEDNYEK